MVMYAIICKDAIDCLSLTAKLSGLKYNAHYNQARGQYVLYISELEAIRAELDKVVRPFLKPYKVYMRDYYGSFTEDGCMLLNLASQSTYGTNRVLKRIEDTTYVEFGEGDFFVYPRLNSAWIAEEGYMDLQEILHTEGSYKKSVMTRIEKLRKILIKNMTI